MEKKVPLTELGDCTLAVGEPIVTREEAGFSTMNYQEIVCAHVVSHQGTRTSLGGTWDWLTWHEGDLDFCYYYNDPGTDYASKKSITPACDANIRHNFKVVECVVFMESAAQGAQVSGVTAGEYEWYTTGAYYHWYENTNKADIAAGESCLFASGSVPGTPDTPTCTVTWYA